jgi:hypothetical protein
MRCFICDKILSENEIQTNKDTKEFEPCPTCLEIALDAAYSDGFSPDGELDDPELQEQFGSGAVPTLESDTYRSYYDFCDAHAYQGNRTSEEE